MRSVPMRSLASSRRSVAKRRRLLQIAADANGKRFPELVLVSLAELMPSWTSYTFVRHFTLMVSAGLALERSAAQLSNYSRELNSGYAPIHFLAIPIESARPNIDVT